ncbi:MAG: DNA-directed RNA polymerase subunit beta', partial [Alphaproteobacteria bacterium]|nr:DNA-directed RNA polymerase subunit beta' [Alphaproteobacteria bacterium]
YARVNGKKYATTAGRMILGELLPEGMPFDSVNKKMPVGEIKKLLAKTYEVCGDKAMILLADALKDTGFAQAVRSGISIGFDDIVVPEEKQKLIDKSEKEAAEIERQYQNGLISSGERHNKLIDLWQHTTDELGNLSFAALGKSEGDNWNSIYMMADSKARGSKAQIQQLAGMRGMMARPDGSIIEVPIISNFKEGLTMSEYFTSTHGARKGMSDTALKTATAGYLTRRLVDLAINTVITEHDCGTHECITAKPVYQGANVSIPLGDIILGRTAAKDIVNPVTNEVIVNAGELVTKAAARQINELHDAGLQSADVRSVLTCQSDGLCAKCYGMDLSRNALVHVGEPVGLIAGQSVGEPGTQLTLRTFHIGGIAEASASEYVTPSAGDIALKDVKTVENSLGQIVVFNNDGEILLKNGDAIIRRWKAKKNLILSVKEGAHVEKGIIVANEDNMNAIVANEAGIVSYNDLEENISYQEEVDNTTGIVSAKVIDWKGKSKKPLNPAILLVNENGEIISSGKKKAEYLLPTFATIIVKNGDNVKAGDVLARTPVQTTKAGDITGGLPRVEELLEVRRPSNPAILADKDGTVELEDAKSKIIIRIDPEDGSAPSEYMVPKGTNILVRSGDVVHKADKLVEGEIVPQDVLSILGQKALAQFMVEQFQQVYRLQGVSINDKHIEILIREMTRRVEISNPGDTAFISGAVVDRVDFEEENERVRKDGGRVAEASQVLVGLTRASLTSRSFISNASFQQTTKVLVDAAISGATDRLLGVNENLIVGRLIPIGTGAYVRRIREIAKEEEKAEKLASEGGEQQLLNIQ